MKVELVEFYPVKPKNEKSTLIGSAHFYLCDFEMDIRGCMVFKKKKNKVMVFLPTKFVKDHETGEDVKFPFISFTDGKKNRELMKSMQSLLLEHFKEKK